MLKKYYLLPVAAMACLVIFMGLPAIAQQGQQQRKQPGVAESQQEISDADLEKAAEAYGEIHKIAKKVRESLQQAETPTERQELQKAANEKMVKAVNEAGIDVAKYNHIMQQVRENDEVKEEFNTKVEKLY